MTRFLIPLFLVLSGAGLVAVGIGTLFTPHAFFASSGAILGTGASLMSEIRAPGGLLLASGIVALVAAVRGAMADAALMLVALIYGAFGAGRLVSMAIDGMPSAALNMAAALELLVTGVALIALRQRSEQA